MWKSLGSKLSKLKSKLFNNDEEIPAKKPRRDEDQKERELDEEMRFYQKEHPVDPVQKVLKESGGQDISAI